MEKVKLTDICRPKQWKTISGDEISSEGKYPVYGANGKMGFFHEYNHIDETLLIGCRGTCGTLHITEKFSYTNGNAMALDNLDKKANIKFLYYFFSKRGFNDVVSGGVQKQITIQNLQRIEIPLPNLATQQRIAAILDQADAIIQNNRAIVQKYDALTQSLFLDMFGDPVKNEKGWEKTELGKLGDFKNGLNYSKSDNGFSLKVIGVGDFKNFSRLDNFSNTSIIEMNEAPRDEFLLKDGDLLFVRSNGNKELVGRCLIVYVGDEKVSYSGFCIRLRLNSNHINSNYLVQLLQRTEFKKHIFKNGRGANIQNINQELLGNIKIQIPPITLQNQFAERVAVIEAQKQQAQLALAKSEALFQSLLQRAFNGELN